MSRYALTCRRSLLFSNDNCLLLSILLKQQLIPLMKAYYGRESIWKARWFELSVSSWLRFLSVQKSYFSLEFPCLVCHSQTTKTHRKNFWMISEWICRHGILFFPVCVLRFRAVSAWATNGEITTNCFIFTLTGRERKLRKTKDLYEKDPSQRYFSWVVAVPDTSLLQKKTAKNHYIMSLQLWFSWANNFDASFLKSLEKDRMPAARDDNIRATTFEISIFQALKYISTLDHVQHTWWQWDISRPVSGVSPKNNKDLKFRPSLNVLST